MTLTKNEHGYYEIRLKGPDGKIKSRSTGKTNKQEAVELIRESKIAELELAAEIGVLSQDVLSVLMTGKTMTVGQAILPWEQSMVRRHLSARSIENSLTWVKAWAVWAKVDKRPLVSLKPEHFDAWVNDLGFRKLGTRKVMLAAIRSFCRFCSDSGWIMGNPANLTDIDMDSLMHNQKETWKRDCFTEEEVDQLCRATCKDGEREDYFWYAAIIIGRWTGLRLGDISSLEWDCLDCVPGKITVWTKKRDKRVQLPLNPPELRECISGLVRQHPTYLFHQQQEIVTDPQRRAGLSMQFSRLLGFCNIYGKCFHCLRATYITDCSKNGIPTPHISGLVGHSNPKTTMGYIRS